MIPCRRCKELRRPEEFHKDRRNASGLSHRCKYCARDRAVKWYYANKDTLDKDQSWSNHLTKYWPYLTPKEALELYNHLCWLQGNKCGICKRVEFFVDPRAKTVRKLSVDHCHKTGKVRALLCNRCNKCLGQFEESIEMLNQAIDYIRKYNE